MLVDIFMTPYYITELFLFYFQLFVTNTMEPSTLN